MHSSLIGKIEKAKRYAQEPDRVTLSEFSADFRGEHDNYTVTYKSNNWNCTCQFFCSGRHVAIPWHYSGFFLGYCP